MPGDDEYDVMVGFVGATDSKRTEYVLDGVPAPDVVRPLGEPYRVHVPVASTRTELHTWETDDAGERWLVVYELRDGKSVEVRRVNARNVTL